MVKEYTPEEVAEMGRQKTVLFEAVRQYKREFIGDGPPGEVKTSSGHATAWLMSNWPDELDAALRVRAIQKMRNRQFFD